MRCAQVNSLGECNGSVSKKMGWATHDNEDNELEAMIIRLETPPFPGQKTQARHRDQKSNTLYGKLPNERPPR